MKKMFALLVTIAACCFLCGCATSQQTQQHWRDRVNKWLPVGTTTEEVYRIMKQNGFQFTESLPESGSVFCQKETGLYRIMVGLSFVNGKLAVPPITDVSRYDFSL